MKYIKFLIVLVAGAFFNSCDDYLDRAPDDKVTEEDVFTRFDKVDGLVTDLYDNVKNANKPLIYFNHFSTAGITDEAGASSHEQAIPHQFNVGNWGPSVGMPANSSAGQYWWDLYTKVRYANVILEGVAKYNTPDNPRSGREGDLQKRLGEVYFLRAYLYYILIKQYGEVPYLDYAVTPQSDMTFEKASVHYVVDKICADADVAYSMLPSYQGDQEFGRADQGACLGLKAMARWLAATPMWNGGTLPNDTRVFKSEYGYDASRWEAAKVAAKAVLDCTNGGNPRYSLYTKYDETNFSDINNSSTSHDGKVQRRLWEMNFDMDAFKAEWVWFSTRDKDTGWSGDMLPPSMGGHARQRPVQEQVDEYEIIIDGYGYPIYSEKAKGVYDDGNPYVNRDPRFYRDIIYHGSKFSNNVINTASGSDFIGADYQSSASHTGYYHRKFFKEGWNRNSGGHVINAPASFRLPTIIYIYAEAVNNTTGPGQEIYNLLNQVRARSFMAPIPPEALTDKALMNDYIQRERRVELFYENDRVWHCRLYLEPDDAGELAKERSYVNENSWPYPKTQRMVHGMRPEEDPDGKIEVGGKTYRMKRFKVEDRVFTSPQHYLFPIMDDELKRTPGLVQNPGW
ncbi:RagB/SusD family nutrient uptake outer membrane protein [termite gut metagenome]|uniref:RagB/SusD family nutrient uptake outer membrane protein n=1 Tax=termite gut metagenome TaxID=433724 RepID=A0A5J4SEA5_9ZZZZ